MFHQIDRSSRYQPTKTKEKRIKVRDIDNLPQRTALNELRCSRKLILLLHQHKHVITLKANYHSIHCTPLFHLQSKKFPHHAYLPVSLSPVFVNISFSVTAGTICHFYSVWRGKQLQLNDREWVTDQPDPAALSWKLLGMKETCYSVETGCKLRSQIWAVNQGFFTGESKKRRGEEWKQEEGEWRPFSSFTMVCYQILWSFHFLFIYLFPYFFDATVSGFLQDEALQWQPTWSCSYRNPKICTQNTHTRIHKTTVFHQWFTLAFILHRIIVL